MSKSLENQYEKFAGLVYDLGQLIWAFKVMPPQGEYAKEEAKREFIDLCGQIKSKIHVICNKQIEALGGKD